MATQSNGVDLSLVAGANLSALQFTFVKLDSNGAVVSCGAGELGFGVLQNKPAAGQAATVRRHGLSKLKAGGTIAAGGTVASGAAGVGVTSVTAGHYVLGQATVGGVLNDIITVSLENCGKI